MHTKSFFLIVSHKLVQTAADGNESSDPFRKHCIRSCRQRLWRLINIYCQGVLLLTDCLLCVHLNVWTGLKRESETERVRERRRRMKIYNYSQLMKTKHKGCCCCYVSTPADFWTSIRLRALPAARLATQILYSFNGWDRRSHTKCQDTDGMATHEGPPAPRATGFFSQRSLPAVRPSCQCLFSSFICAPETKVTRQRLGDDQLDRWPSQASWVMRI